MSYSSKFTGKEVERRLDLVIDLESELNEQIGNIQTTLDQKVPKTTTINGKDLSGNIILTASDLGIDTDNDTDAALTAAKQYTDNKIAALVDGAPETLNTLDEIATALRDNEQIVDALTDAIGKKQNTIDDLSIIRSGANKGATAVQPSAISDMETKTNAAATYQLKITNENKLDYSFINNVPTSLSQFNNDLGFIGSSVLSNYATISDLSKYLPLTGGFVNGVLSVKHLFITYAENDTQYQVYHEGNLSNVSQLINDANYISVTDTDDTEIDDIAAVYVTETLLESELEKKQDKLVSGTNVRTVNGTSILGSGNIEIKNNNEDILNLVYPIGSIYLSVNEVNPSTLFGFGEWEMIKDTFLLGAGDTYQAGSTGGEATHTLTTSEMPSHAHYIVTASSNEGSEWDCPPARQKSSWWDTHVVSSTNASAGGDQPHNNMPPYLTVYIWKRIS